jgi:diacylglycerol kinase family enzyme
MSGGRSGHFLVVANPRATAMTARERKVLERALAGTAEDVEVAETANRGHAAALACRAMRGGADAVIAMGGDGTVNEVVNGLLTDGIHDRVPALGVVPAGSTNVFARALGLPNSPVEATGALIEALRSGARRTVSLGRVDDRWFVFAAGIGFDAAIVAGVDRQRRRGKRSTHALYARVGVREFFAADRRAPQVHVELPGGERIDDVHFALVTNCDPWTFVGNRPLHPTPQTSFETGLGLYARRRMGMLGILWSVARMSGASPHVGSRGAAVRQDLEQVTVLSDVPLPVHVDGEYVYTREKLSFTSAARALAVLA